MEELAIEHAGFRKGRGTRDHITNLRIIMEKETNFNSHCISVLQKSLDSAPHQKLLYQFIMLEMGFPTQLVQFL